MEYKGFRGVLVNDLEDPTFYGYVDGIRDVVTFSGKTYAEAVQAFKDSVDDYLDMLKGN